MRVGTNMALYFYARDDKNMMDDCEIIRRLKEIGFETIDYVFTEMTRPEYILRGDDWQYRVDRVADALAKYGMKASQVHLPFVGKGVRKWDDRFQVSGFVDFYEESMRRAYLAAEMLQAPWAVAHCEINTMSYYTSAYALNYNRNYFDPYVELGIKHGVGTAFENMFQGVLSWQRVRYCACYEELIEFVDSYQDSRVGICWDFGHANVMHVDQSVALREVGKRLKCVHVDDNLGENDQHLLPFMGNVDWPAIMPVLKEIGYEGDLSLETGPITKKAPRALQPSYVKAAYDSICYLRKLTGLEEKA